MRGCEGWDGLIGQAADVRTGMGSLDSDAGCLCVDVRAGMGSLDSDAGCLCVDMRTGMGSLDRAGLGWTRWTVMLCYEAA
jgi:hypothetical protein